MSSTPISGAIRFLRLPGVVSRLRLRSVALLVLLVAAAFGFGVMSPPIARTQAVSSAALDVTPGPRSGASPMIVQHWGSIVEAARRHNKLDVSNYQFAQFMEQMLTIEQGGEVCSGQILCASQVWYPLWSRIQSTTNDERGTNASVGLGQIRPETAGQLTTGWIKHGGHLVRHGVQPAYRVIDENGTVVSSRLEDPAVSIEYLAANLEMGTAVARYFGYEPTLEDLARWHNTGIGWWTYLVERVPESTWLKGSGYVARVRAIGWDLANPEAANP